MKQRKRKCFIISAYGNEHADEGDPARLTWERSTAVVETLIRPAVELIDKELTEQGLIGLEYYRSDFVPGGKEIGQKVQTSIYRDDVCIAVFLRANENVAYEVGLAHALGRPVILLSHDSYEMPSDIIGLERIVFADAQLEVGSAPQVGLVSKLADTLRVHLPANGAHDFTPGRLTQHAAPPARCIALDRVRPAFSEWSETLLDARESIWLAGSTLYEFFYKRDEFEMPVEDEVNGEETIANVFVYEILSAQCRLGVDINVMILSENHPALDQILVSPQSDPDDEIEDFQRQVRKTTSKVRQQIEALVTLSSPDDPSGTFRFIKVEQGLLPSRVLMSEQLAYITPFYSALSINTGPGFLTFPKAQNEFEEKIPPRKFNHSLYATTREELEFLARINPSLVMRPDGKIADNLIRVDSDDRAQTGSL